jgi:hypothetical protein
MEAVQYVAGRFDVYWSTKLQRLRPEPALPRKSNYKANFLLRTLEQMISVLSRETPRPRATPVDSESWDKAENTEFILMHDHRVMKMDDVRDLVYRWSLCTGLGWIRAGWDPHAGDRLRQQTFEVYEDGEGFRRRRPAIVDGVPLTIDGFTGAPYARVISPFNVIFDIACLSLEERGVFQPRYIIEQNLYPVSAVENAYPKIKGKIRPERSIDSMLMRDLMFGGMGSMAGAADSEKMCVVHEEWRPWSALSKAERKKHPHGIVTRICQGHVLEKFDNPYMGRIPYFVFPCYPVLGRFLPQGIIPHLVSAQMAYNRLAGREHDALIYHVPKLLMPTGARQAEGHWSTEFGEILDYDARRTAGQAPSFITPPDVGPQYERMRMFIKNDIQDTSAVHEALQGQNPPGGRSGRLAFANIQANLLSHSRLESSLTRRLGEVYEFIAFCERRFGHASRTFSILGDDGFISRTISPQASIEYSDVWIDAQSERSISESSEIEFAFQLLGSGALTDEMGRPDLKTFRRMVKLRSAGPAYEEEAEVEKRTKWEIDQILSGQNPTYGPAPDGTPMMMNPAADLEVVHKTYRRFINSKRYMGLPPMLQRRILDRWDLVVARLQDVPPQGMMGEGDAGMTEPGSDLGGSPQAPVAGAGGGPEESGLARTLVGAMQGGPA